ncbi:transcription termination factor NusA [Thermobrachium celere]|uniref:Transcription termination/antitermination protein NusA n=1 Tax=Thermobrachium celere DSM 8682 TaxID=941824 RepID=R7RPG4_9CLOT|nr:transcription termination factor NusA [Thermobrachium celere]GFR36552.1 transcription termination/antitermination protein NusA [Thermobrachium celere]CDF57949.1 Transcription termination protein NusA [Thermobrachium celere DSM 8682]
MNSVELIEALKAIVQEKGIDEDIIFNALESALVAAYKKNYGTSQNVKVTINRETGEIHVYAQKKVVEDVYDNLLEISLEDARKIDVRYNLDDVVDIEITPKDFLRASAQVAKQRVIQEIREQERKILYEEFIQKENDIITGIVQKKENDKVLVDIGKTETLLNASEQMPNDTYSHGERLKFYVVEVKKTTKGPNIIISRTHPGLVKRLFELEVPEIYEGIVEIKSIAREAGSRTKIAVHSRDENVDATGACVGPKGVRVQNVVNELRGEKIDIVKWSKDPVEFIQNALSPAKVVSVEIIDEKERIARVIVPDYQLSLAIGKEGQNARLAAKLTGWKIDIKSESQVQELNKEE